MGAFRWGLELAIPLTSVYCVPTVCQDTSHTWCHLILKPAYVVDTNNHSHFTDEKTTGRISKDYSKKVGKSIPGRENSLYVSLEARKPGGEG